MKIKISELKKKQIKFTTKLLVVVAVAGLVFGYLVQVGIYKAADAVTNAYTEGFVSFK